MAREGGMAAKKPNTRKKSAARKRSAARPKAVARKKPARKKLKPPKRPPHKRLPRRPPKTQPPNKHRLPAPEQWLKDHPQIAAAIKWQFRPADPLNAYAAPTASDKLAWANWSQQQKADLRAAYVACRDWFAAGAQQVAMGAGTLTDAPTNLYAAFASDTNTVMESVSPAYMWQLYVEHVAFSLAAEITQQLPWSITSYANPQLRYLFDSSTMAWNIRSQEYVMGTYAVFVPALRAHNLPKTAFAPPKWTYPFLAQAGLIGTTRLDTIGRVLEWMRQNLWHFIGTDNFGTCNAIWQYRGYPPLSRIVNGTTDANWPGFGVRHWTLGCHGSVGFLNAVLRVVNIPVQPVWVCGHQLAYFMLEKKYLDHGDDPYNLIVRNSTAPILDVLIDQTTYETLFTTDLKANIAAPKTACANVGYTAAHFPP
jgi:hypothetical protein